MSGGDNTYTPVDVARAVIKHFSPSGRILDPCKGGGAFFDNLPAGAEYCEICEGTDFFDETRKFDWVISNPPYSIFAKWLDHSFTAADNVVYLIPINKAFNSFAMMKRIAEFGGVKEILAIAPGGRLKFPIGFAIGAVHFQKGWCGPTTTTFL